MTSQIDSQKLIIGRYMLNFFEKMPTKFIKMDKISEDLSINPKIVRRTLNREFIGVIQAGDRGKFKLSNEEALQHLRDTIDIFEGLANHSTERK